MVSPAPIHFLRIAIDQANVVDIQKFDRQGGVRLALQFSWQEVQEAAMDLCRKLCVHVAKICERIFRVRIEEA